MSYTYLIRHAESTINRNPTRIWGHFPQAPLTEKGIEQALQLRNWIENEFDEIPPVYTSTARRTQETARISLPADTPLIIDGRLNEISRGEYEGRSFKEIPKNMSYATQPFTSVFPTGESYEIGGQRFLSGLQDILEQHEESLCFTHGNVIRAGVLTLLEGMDWRVSKKTPIYNTQVFRVESEQLKKYQEKLLNVQY
ncbi:MAG: histidine phosphatase family protein [Candidatus Woesearchaeota archaeon]